MRTQTPSRRASSDASGQRLPQSQKNSWGSALLANIKRYYWLYLFVLPAVAMYIIFEYIPMGGIVIAFKRYTGAKSIWASKWVGLRWFEQFFGTFYAERTIKNTLILSLYTMAMFPLPILLALVFDEVRNQRYKKTAQTIMYAPHFVSTVVLISMLSLFFNPNYGFVNKVIEMFGGKSVDYLTDPAAFRHLYVWSGVWQATGWGCIIYTSALSAVDPNLHEAASLDGASRFKRIIHIKLPTILPTIVIMLIMRCGTIMSVGTDKVLLMKNDLNASTAEVIGTLVYQRGLVDGQYGFAAAVGLFQNVINFLLLITVNKVSEKVTETSLF